MSDKLKKIVVGTLLVGIGMATLPVAGHAATSDPGVPPDGGQNSAHSFVVDVGGSGLPSTTGATFTFTGLEKKGGPNMHYEAVGPLTDAGRAGGTMEHMRELTKMERGTLGAVFDAVVKGIETAKVGPGAKVVCKKAFDSNQMKCKF